jgi:hypothetical protein
MGMNWEVARKRDLVRERGSEDYRGTPGLGKKPRNKKRRSQRFKNIRNQWTTTCKECKGVLPAGKLVKYYYEEKKVTHATCKLTLDAKE